MLSVRRQGADRANPLSASAGWATSAPSPAEPCPWASRAEAQGCGCWPGGLRPAGRPQGRRGLLALLGSARLCSAGLCRHPALPLGRSPPSLPCLTTSEGALPSPLVFHRQPWVWALGCAGTRWKFSAGRREEGAGGALPSPPSAASQPRVPCASLRLGFGDGGCVGRLQAGIFPALWGGVGGMCVWFQPEQCLNPLAAPGWRGEEPSVLLSRAVSPHVLEETHSPCPCRGAGGAG